MRIFFSCSASSCFHLPALHQGTKLLCVSSLLTTTEAVVVELPKEKKDIPAMGGGMGGMY